LFFCIGDVSGKGVPAALIMAVTRSLFRSATSYMDSPARIVTQMNDSLSSDNEQNMFVTLLLGILDMDNGELLYCNAGHNSPLIVESQRAQKQRTPDLKLENIKLRVVNGELKIESGSLRTEDAEPDIESGPWVVKSLSCVPNLPLGVLSGFEYQEQKTKLAVGDILFLYTDGLSEAENSRHEQFGEARMEEQLRLTAGKQPADMVKALQQAVGDFAGEAEQSDDLTLFAIRLLQTTPSTAQKGNNSSERGQHFALVMRNDIQQIPTLAEWVESLNLPEAINMSINLALEEIVSNVMLYAYPDTQSGRVMVEAEKFADKIIFTISDSGIAFDPTEQAEPDLTLSVEERPIGGLGIHLVRQIMDEIHYKRLNEKNILTLVKSL
jgi:sigma-B regulation protein RsbU (phosphoserine phosphatase)